MLVSHLKSFIFVKSIKTAGTSIESYFEKYCMPSGEWAECHYRDQYISEAGIIGYRGENKGDSIYYNHMPAAQIKSLVGDEIWKTYFKFSVVRNPYDKMISAFYFYKSLDLDRNIRTTGNDIADFRAWLPSRKKSLDAHIFLIENDCAVDFFIKYENLHQDIEFVCKKVGIEYEPHRLPEFKKGFRDTSKNIADFYDSASIEIIKDTYKFEIDKFGYEIPN